MPKATSKNQPLTPAVLHILLALSRQDMHGYAIMKRVEKDSGGEVPMGPGTLYGCLNRMMEAGLVVESAAQAVPELKDARRIYYRITPNGRSVLSREINRLEQILDLVKNHKLGVSRAHGS
jgi:DNA-binding PadR family transcriptional regulator